MEGGDDRHPTAGLAYRSRVLSFRHAAGRHSYLLTVPGPFFPVLAVTVSTGAWPACWSCTVRQRLPYVAPDLYGGGHAETDPCCMYLKNLPLLPWHLLTQNRFAHCEEKRPNFMPWLTHLVLVVSYLTMLVLIMCFLSTNCSPARTLTGPSMSLAMPRRPRTDRRVRSPCCTAD